MKKTFYILPLLLINLAALAVNYPANVQNVLRKAGNNRSELEAVLMHYQPDSLKYKAACFLIGNMDIHYSQTYYWADSLGHAVVFNELSYPDFSSSQIAFNSLREHTRGIHPVPVRIPDIQTVGRNFLIDNIERAFLAWKKKAGGVSFEDFCEYILPYRISVEPLQAWRGKYEKQFAWLPDSLAARSSGEACAFFDRLINKEFENLYYKGITRKEPLPRLGAVQLQFRKKGLCEDAADYGVFMLRSQGYPASVDYIPYWATSSGSHTLWHIDNVNTHSEFDLALKLSTQMPVFGREPSKVIRTTYARQPNVLANIEAQENIPDNFLRMYNYKDVTAEYWPVKSLSCKLDTSATGRMVYACVLNYQKWEPTWWAQARADSAEFDNMTLGVVYLPAFYKQGQLLPAGYPVALGYNNKMVLQPDTDAKRYVVIEEQDKYLKFRPGKRYTLLYWDKKWKELETQTADTDTHRLYFNHVPGNALLILIPDYSEYKERPFIITDEGTRVWF
ncbi:MAG TPA: hypothetical protein VK152_11115 [Paludibacter sp.]|nr:hypothetical protein [Paludibacter sp.]